MITLNDEEAEKLLELMKARFLKAHLNTAMYGAAAYANGNSDRVILRAVKNGDAPELKIMMAAMALIPEEEDNSEKTA
ncbi:hypothetical protein MKR04_24645 [Klebsiella sp. K4-38]|jgi:hypothetical protein|uniref:hypothetical protein n=1 Tax=Klebsiella TaxID=570 RepID=UPI0002410AF5|nr:MULTISPECIES: hypothetical protein [Klebsiella]HBX3983479.1 hypothetical protein [Klebsiella pneumoniae subsp. pneumoniae]EHL93046.1 hypothetical protein HMPREF1024_01896 [Klebsiella sp. 4_1_44FAA]EIW0066228.1 hypothetical protein [Klebsiella pneumoniae]EIW0694648.1 hypothetical protein [Klebsiella pneumoniae]EIW1147695.1 hypothetical protein [Klebsiella pneumoniae]